MFVLFNNKLCLKSNMENLTPNVIRMVTKELAELEKNPPEGIRVTLNDSDITDIHAIIDGPGLFSEM